MDQIELFKIGSTYGSNTFFWKLEVPMDQIDFFENW